MVRLSLASIALGAVATVKALTSSDCTGVNAISTNSMSRSSFPWTPAVAVVEGAAATKPIVFFHGGGTTGVTWLNTPDNRPGWATYFLQKGHTVYLVDVAGIGRPTENNLAAFTLLAGTAAEGVERGFTNVEAYDAYPQAKLHTQWPGTGKKGDSAFEQFKKTIIPLSTSWVPQELALRASGCELLSLLGEKAYLVSHSIGARTPILLSNDCPQHIAGNINLEGTTVPFWSFESRAAANPWGLTNTPIDYDPPVAGAEELEIEVFGNDTPALRSCYRQKEPVRKLPKIASVPYLMVTAEASVHATYDHCTVDYLRQIGGEPDWIKLVDRGIHGNGHFMHLEKNNWEIAEVVSEWIRGKDGDKM
ncbi:hypothetical protein CSUB01_12186 [Colletotrichum sublineola]|uniref:AB hydrolase-1 domain-containing protein n=1 Tax=Colletotrichum sublineola TaxID=1173701 RepID=A0A066WTN2_COLSU|nr:hypothetical protein CSUB01_12186 [Colletotrichum sublineola]